MQKPARRHHYLPRFYLAGFTADGKKDDWLYVFDLESGNPKPRKQRPDKVGFVCDLNRLDWPGLPLDYLEKGPFAKFDGLVAPLVREVAESGQFDGKLEGILRVCCPYGCS